MKKFYDLKKFTNLTKHKQKLTIKSLLFIISAGQYRSTENVFAKYLQIVILK